MKAWPAPQLPQIPGTPVPLRLYDSSRQAVAPVTPGAVAGMYVCGITPYDATHLGHAATYVTFDLINRILRDNGHDVRFVQNVTDVDDPLFERADRDGVDWRKLGDEQTDLFRSDMTALSILPPAAYVGATESIEEVIDLVKTLFDVGAAYQISADDDADYQDVYYSYDATSQFGYESGFTAKEMKEAFAERGGDPERVGKHHPLDALLWRQQRPGEPAWDSPWGAGRPGWHIECAAIALNRLGTGFDIQGGGEDLIFPHHEFSAAHVEAATGHARMARHYVHTGMIYLQGQKMSKSLGNLEFVHRLLDNNVPAGAIRIALYLKHYREAQYWDGDEDYLNRALQSYAMWQEATSLEATLPAEPLISQIRSALSDDLDTERAVELIDRWAQDSLAGLGEDSSAPRKLFDAVDALLGIKLQTSIAEG